MMNVYTHFNITSVDALKCNDIAQLAISQAITNVYELCKKIRIETINKMPLLKSINLKVSRNISSHDYDRLDFAVTYKQTKLLLNPEIYNELEATIHGLKLSEGNNH